MDKDFMSEEEKKEKQGYLLLQKALHGRSALSYSEGIRNTAVRIRNSIVESSLMQVKSKHKMAREFNPYTYNIYYSKDGELQKQLNNNLLSDILAEMYLMAAEKAFYGEAVLGYPVPLVFEQTRLAHQDNTNYYTLLKSKDSDFEVLLQRLGFTRNANTRPKYFGNNKTEYFNNGFHQDQYDNIRFVEPSQQYSDFKIAPGRGCPTQGLIIHEDQELKGNITPQDYFKSTGKSSLPPNLSDLLTAYEKGERAPEPPDEPVK